MKRMFGSFRSKQHYQQPDAIKTNSNNDGDVYWLIRVHNSALSSSQNASDCVVDNDGGPGKGMQRMASSRSMSFSQSDRNAGAFKRFSLQSYIKVSKETNKAF